MDVRISKVSKAISGKLEGIPAEDRGENTSYEAPENTAVTEESMLMTSNAKVKLDRESI